MEQICSFFSFFVEIYVKGKCYKIQQGAIFEKSEVSEIGNNVDRSDRVLVGLFTNAHILMSADVHSIEVYSRALQK